MKVRGGMLFPPLAAISLKDWLALKANGHHYTMREVEGEYRRIYYNLRVKKKVVG
jgi:hypothetical protein